MKIAIITEDGKTISQHFGRAPYYLVVTIENGKIAGSELREKIGHTQFAGQGEGHMHQHGRGSSHEDGNGFGAQAHDRHMQMAEAIDDCEVLLCRGMGRGAYQSLQEAGIKPFVTEVISIDEAVTRYIQGELTDRVDKLH